MFHSTIAAVTRLRPLARKRCPIAVSVPARISIGSVASADRVDADHEASSPTKRAHPSGSEDGHFTVMVCSPKGSSMITDGSVARVGVTFTGTNAGSVRAVDLDKAAATYGSHWN